MINPFSKYFFLFLIFLNNLLLSGCLNPFAPKLTDKLEAGDYIITQQKSPEEVLQNFKVAYTYKDSLLYRNCLDTAFLFVYFDPNIGTSGQFVSWGRDVDLMTTGKLFHHFQVIDLVWNSVIYSEEAEERGEISQGFDLTLIAEQTNYQLSGRALFSFRKCKDEQWRITRWKDESDI